MEAFKVITGKPWRPRERPAPVVTSDGEAEAAKSEGSTQGVEL